MGMNDIQISSGRFGSALAIQVVTGSRLNRISKIGSDGAVIIELDVDETSNAVNQVLIEYLGNLLAVNIDQIEIVAGENNRKKLVSIVNISPGEVQRIIDQQLG